MSDINVVRFVQAGDIDPSAIICAPSNVHAENDFRARKLGDTHQAVFKRARSPRFHNMVMKIINDLFDNQETYTDKEVFRVVIKLKCGWVFEEPIVTGKGQVQWVPKPTNWSDCGEDEFREFFEKLKPIVWEKLGEDAWARYRL